MNGEKETHKRALAPQRKKYWRACQKITAVFGGLPTVFGISAAIENRSLFDLV
jgi:hypothetical protein